MKVIKIYKQNLHTRIKVLAAQQGVKMEEVVEAGIDLLEKEIKYAEQTKSHRRP